MRVLGIVGAAAVVVGVSGQTEEWKPVEGRLMTRWAAEVSPENALREYPRPTMSRANWLNLNGLWQWAEAPADGDAPSEFPGSILVPFPIESALSGVARTVEHLWYRRTFDVPPAWREGRVLLHFGAVDWHARVWVNGRFVGEHVGGYDGFSFDVTDALVGGDEQTVTVSVWDPTDGHWQPRGKQVREPHGIWYTPTTGIWQTVWVEPVPNAYVRRLHVTPDFDTRTVRVRADAAAEVGYTVRVKASIGSVAVAEAAGAPGEELTLDLASDFRPWSPDQPRLYDLVVELLDGERVADRVASYCGVRKVEVRPDAEGVERIHLNGEPIFVFGPLDQGFWPDGLYTAPTDAALMYDLIVTKRLGFNAVRKHVKVEPERWYWWCDVLGLLVLQDMPSGDAYVGPGRGEIARSAESAAQFERELRAMVEGRMHHPSVVCWVPFNEGWGQYDTVRIANWVKELDPTRLVICASGWNDYPAGDLIDWHAYPGPASPRPSGGRAAFLGEYGGLGLPLAGHTWQDEKNWGYRSYTDRGALTEAYLALADDLRLLIADPGLSGAIYTQTTDVEVEVNGLMTYDREVIKMDEMKLLGAHLRLYAPPPRVREIAGTSRGDAVEWAYTFERPADGWEKPGFDDSSWQRGPGGFGREGTPGAVVRTPWHTGDVWIRRRFILPRVLLHDPRLLIHHDEDAEVYVNGVPAAELKGYTTGYVVRRMSEAARESLISGPVTIAVHCRQTTGGQYVDVGIVDVVEGGE